MRLVTLLLVCSELVSCQFLNQFKYFKDDNNFEPELTFTQVGEIIQLLKAEYETPAKNYLINRYVVICRVVKVINTV